MRKIYLLGGLVVVLLLWVYPLQGQNFTPSETYQQIQVDYYKALALPLSPTMERSYTHTYNTYRPATYRYTEISSTNRPTHGVVMNISPWKGKVQSVDNELALATPAIRRSTGIGSGNLPGDPEGENSEDNSGIGGGNFPGDPNGTHSTAIGDIPIWLLMLLMGAYVVYRGHKQKSRMWK